MMINGNENPEWSDIYWILEDSNNPLHFLFRSNADFKTLAEYLHSCGVSITRPDISMFHICPVCQGKGFLPGNFYELPGQSVSYAGYTNLSSSSVSCRSCQGKGFVELEKAE